MGNDDDSASMASLIREEISELNVTRDDVYQKLLTILLPEETGTRTFLVALLPNVTCVN